MIKQQFRRQNTHFKVIWCIFLIVAILLVTQISVVSAFEFDNIGRYNETSRTFTIRNSVLGIPFLQLGTVAEIELKTSDVVYIIRGKDRQVAEFTINNYEKDYSNALKLMEFYDMNKGMEKFERDFTYKYKRSLGFETINDYEEVCVNTKDFGNGTILQDCSQELIGTHQEEKFEWVEFDTSKKLSAGKITIGIFTDVLPNDKVEWIPTLFGVRIGEWAVWKDSFEVGLVAYYNFNSESGTAAYDWTGNYNGTLIGMEESDWISSGILGNALLFEDPEFVNVSPTTGALDNIGSGSLTACLWMNTTLRSNSQASMYKRLGTTWPIGFIGPEVTTGYVRFYIGDGGNYPQITGTTDAGDGEWHLVCGVRDTGLDKLLLYTDGTHDANMTDPTNVDISNPSPLLIGAFATDGYVGALDEIGIWNRALNASEILELWNGGSGITPLQSPTVTLNSPVNAYNTTNPIIDFNCTASDDKGITNVSLLINGIIKQTNSSGINNANYLFTETITTGGFYNWTCQAYNDDNRSTIATARSFTYSNGLIVSLVSPVNAYNSTSSSISFNGTASDETAVINVSLYIDGVLNQTDSSGLNATDYLFTSSLSDGNYNWTYQACDAVSCVFATTRTFTVDTTPDIQFIAPTYANNTNLTSSYIPVNVSLTETYFENITFNFYNGTLTSFFFTDSTRFINESFADGSYYYNVTVWTTTGQSNSTVTRNISVDATLPVINITYPVEKINYHVLNTNLSLNWTATDAHLDSCWYNYNGTNTTVTCSDNHTNLNITEYSNDNATFYANDTFGNLNSFYREWVYKIFENHHIYNNESYEMALETFSMNISSDGDEIILGTLVYNGTSYLGTKTGDNYNMEFNRTIALPQLGNISFYWSFNYGGEILNSSTFYQNVSGISMGVCGGIFVTPVLNFTAYDEENRTRLIPYNFYGTFEYWTGDGSVTKNFSVSNTSVNETLICININETFYSNAIIQYEKTSYVKRNYYLINDTITNVSQNIDLFLLLTASSTSFIIDVIDEAQFSVADAYIYIQRYYPGTNTYETVEMALTDGSGSTIGHFEAETEDYRIIIEVDGVIIYQSGTQKIFCRETPCTLTFQTEGDVGVTWEDFGIIDEFDWTLNYDETTNIWTFVYTDTSSSIGYGRLYVFYTKPDEGEITICNTNSSLLADTLTCDVTGYNGTIYAKAYLSRSPEILVYLKSIQRLIASLGLEGLFLSMFVLMLLGFIGLWNPTVGIISVVGGVIILNFMGLASFGAVTIIGLIFIAAIILWGLKS